MNPFDYFVSFHVQHVAGETDVLRPRITVVRVFAGGGGGGCHKFAVECFHHRINTKSLVDGKHAQFEFIDQCDNDGCLIMLLFAVDDFILHERHQVLHGNIITEPLLTIIDEFSHGFFKLCGCHVVDEMGWVGVFW